MGDPVMTAVRHGGWTIAVLVTFTLLGVVGLIGAEAVPDTWVIDALEEAEASGALDREEQPVDDTGAPVDEFSECITLSVGLAETANQGMLDTVALAPHLGPCERLVANLNPYDGASAAADRGTYLRYWHGSTPVVRPLLALVGLAGLRVVGMAAVVVAGAAVFGLVRRRYGAVAAVGLLAPTVVTTSILSLPGSIHQAIAFAVGLGGAALVGTVATGGLTGPRVWYVSLLAGAAFVYVDLLTVVPGQWALVAALVGLAAVRAGRSPIETTGWTLLAGVAWLVGYAGMWFGKWAFAAAVLGRQRVVDDVRDTIGDRIDGDSAFAEPGFGNAIADNVDRFLDRPFSVAFLVATAVVVVGSTARRSPVESAGRAVVAATAVVPLIWFEILSNHSQVHAWFTYRSLPMALGIVLLAFLARLPGPEPSSELSEPDSVPAG